MGEIVLKTNFPMMIAGEYKETGSIIAVSRSIAKDLLEREAAVLATEDDAPVELADEVSGEPVTGDEATGDDAPADKPVKKGK